MMRTAFPALLVVSGIGLGIWLWPESRPAPQPTPVEETANRPPAAPAAAPQSFETRDAVALPPSLRDTEVDGDLPVDARGNLIVGPEVRQLFDYFLSASGEEPDAVIRQRIIAEIQRRLPPRAAAQALALLDRYLEYRARGSALAAPEWVDLEMRLAAVQELRREVFGARDAAALFGDGEELDRAGIERRLIAEDPRLTPEEKVLALEEIERDLPADVREFRERARAALTLMQDERDLRANGASPSEIRQLRESRFGAEAADRLDALDRARAEWNRRVEAFRAESDAIDADPGLTPQEREQLRRELLDASFSATEQLRLRALESETIRGGDRTS